MTGSASVVAPGSDECDAVMRVLPDAIPCELHSELKRVFAPDSAFWEETGYHSQERGYFSFYYNLASSPSHVVEKLITSLRSRLPRKAREAVVGAEWWLHTKPGGRHVGHQLHFDTDEAALAAAAQRGIRKKRKGKASPSFPIYSTVCYVTTGAVADDAGGAT